MKYYIIGRYIRANHNSVGCLTGGDYRLGTISGLMQTIVTVDDVEVEMRAHGEK